MIPKELLATNYTRCAVCTLKKNKETGSGSGRQMQWEVQIIIKSDGYHQILIHNPIPSIKILTFKLLRIVQFLPSMHVLLYPQQNVKKRGVTFAQYYI